jgi:hypothetical protein
MEEMQITKLSSDFAMEHCSEVARQTDEELQREFDYYIAEKLTKQMLEKGLISTDECTRILAENRHFFSPILAELA